MCSISHENAHGLCCVLFCCGFISYCEFMWHIYRLSSVLLLPWQNVKPHNCYSANDIIPKYTGALLVPNHKKPVCISLEMHCINHVVAIACYFIAYISFVISDEVHFINKYSGQYRKMHAANMLTWATVHMTCFTFLNDHILYCYYCPETWHRL